MEAFNGADEYIFLVKTIKKYQKDGKPCGDYIGQLNKLMTQMEKEYGHNASVIFKGLDKIAESQLS